MGPSPACDLAIRKGRINVSGHPIRACRHERPGNRHGPYPQQSSGRSFINGCLYCLLYFGVKGIIMKCLRQGTRKARKIHRCEGFDQIDHFGWAEAQQAGAMLPPMPHAIWPGDKYHYQVNVDGGELFEWKSCKHCYAIIVEQQLWDDQ